MIVEIIKIRITCSDENIIASGFHFFSFGTYFMKKYDILILVKNGLMNFFSCNNFEFIRVDLLYPCRGSDIFAELISNEIKRFLMGILILSL